MAAAGASKQARVPSPPPPLVHTVFVLQIPRSCARPPVKSLQCGMLVQLQSPFDLIMDHNENTCLGLEEWPSWRWENRSHSAGAKQSTRQPGLVALGVSHLSQAAVSEVLAKLSNLWDATLLLPYWQMEPSVKIFPGFWWKEFGLFKKVYVWCSY